ncbi:MAG: 2Fe-2S iron-sulfur cluster binding domain-containing protein [Alphaproteobacteria bacterium]|nr:2Fe-2S iron-sulfur cluster binding domain-containing protein [Alphaproteobacteria bacterium]
MSARRYRVVRKVQESEVIASFYLEAEDGGPLDPFKAGQFLTFEVVFDGRDDAEIRQYSLSNAPDERDHYRITVKREDAPLDRAHFPPGLVSHHLHGAIDAGAGLVAHAPRGQFVLEENSTRPVVLLSGGVGLTPTVSMLHALADEGERDVWFVHACDNGRVHAMADEVRAVAARSPRIHTHFCYRFPDQADVAEGRFDSEGIVTRDLLQKLLPLDDYEFYICGPSPFMKAIYEILRSLGVHNDRVRFEFFGPATLIIERDERSDAAPAVVDGHDRVAPGEEQPTPVAAAVAAAAVEPPASGPLVTFLRAGITVSWKDSAGTLLELAESHSLEPEFSCRAGVCNTCQCRLVSGEVEYVEEPLDEPKAGEVLICCSRPRTHVELDI